MGLKQRERKQEVKEEEEEVKLLAVRFLTFQQRVLWDRLGSRLGSGGRVAKKEKKKQEVTEEENEGGGRGSEAVSF